MSLLENLIPGVSEAKLIAGAVGAAVLFGAGVAADRMAPWIGANAQEAALHSTISAKDQALGRSSAALISAAKAIALRDAAISDRDAIIKANGTTETSDASQTSDFWRKQARLAYDEGYAARVCGPGAPPPPVGVRDLGDSWDAGRFVPATPATPADTSPSGAHGHG